MDENIYGLPENREIDEAELERQADVYEKGRRLRTLTNSPDWELVVQTLQDYRDKARDALIALPPGDKNVLQAHAAASATNDVFTMFTEDINSVISAAQNPSPELTQYLMGIRRSLDVQTAMGLGE